MGCYVRRTYAAFPVSSIDSWSSFKDMVCKRPLLARVKRAKVETK